MVADRDTSQLPEQTPTQAEIATATSTAAAINVRHAQDADGDELFKVTVEVFVEVPAESATDFEALLDLRSGVLEVRDADAVEALEVGAGSWRLAVIARPADHPQHVAVYLNRP